jgi:DNA-binding response OmpR family regulator
MLRKRPPIPAESSRPPDFSPRNRENFPSPVVLVVSHDSLLRWALYEALAAAQFRVLTCSHEAHAHEILPHVQAQFAVAVIDDDTWAITRHERDWLHRRWPDLPIVVLAHPGQGLEHRVKELELADVVLKPFDVQDLVQVVRVVASDRHVSLAR